MRPSLSRIPEFGLCAIIPVRASWKGVQTSGSAKQSAFIRWLSLLQFTDFLKEEIMAMLLTRRVLHIAVWLGAVVMAGCGGGGGSGSPPPATTAPAITAQPQSVTVLDGQSASFGVTASGTAPLTYQWRRNGSDIAGATGNAYALAAATLADSGASFSVQVSNSAGPVTSNAATLTVNPVAPLIATQPASIGVSEGQAATFAVVAVGSAPLAYQWRRGGVDIAGANANAASFTTPVAVIGDNGVLFSVVVSNAAGSVTSAEATLTVSAASAGPSITAQPAAVTVAASATASFTVTAIGSAPLAYQWRRNAVNVTGATAASYTTPATAVGDDGARFSVVVSNALGSVTSGEALLTVTATAPPPSARYVPVWSSNDTTAGSGSYTLSVVDPVSPANLIAVDQVPAASITDNFLNVFGGDFDAASGQVLDAGVRNLVYQKAGSLYRVNLDKGGATPSPVRLSTETQAGFLSIEAVSASGDEALISYFLPNVVLRYVSLSAGAAAAPRAAPVFPGDVPSSTRFLGSAIDPVTGAISALYWESAPLSVMGRRLFRTDLNFGNAASIATFSSSALVLPLGAGPSGTEGRMRRGMFFIADGALQRLDFATGVVRVVHADVNFRVGVGVFDDTHLYVMLQNNAGVRQIVRAADDNSSLGQLIATGTTLAAYSGISAQTRDYLIFITGFNDGTAVSMRKTDGLLTPLPPPPGSTPALSHSWNTLALLSDETVGNRVFYRLALGGFGSVDADGTDRREHAGNLRLQRMVPAALPPHRLHTGVHAARILVGNGSTLRWLELASGELGVVVGTEPAGANVGHGSFSLSPIGRAGSTGSPQAPTATTVGRLDAFYLTDQANSLLRLTNFIP